MFDDRSFDTRSFDTRSWSLGSMIAVLNKAFDVVRAYVVTKSSLTTKKHGKRIITIETDGLIG